MSPTYFNETTKTAAEISDEDVLSAAAEQAAEIGVDFARLGDQDVVELAWDYYASHEEILHEANAARAGATPTQGAIPETQPATLDSALDSMMNDIHNGA